MLIINIPFEGRNKIPGCKLGPIEILKQILYEKKNNYNISNIINMLNFTSKEKINEIKEAILVSLEKNNINLILGGDHSTTSFVINKLIYKTHPSLIVFDAHNDYSIDYDGTYSNWNVLNAVEDIINNGIVIGCRYKDNLMPECTKLQYIWEEELRDFKYVEESILKMCTNSELIYLSIDLDVLNPVEFPGVGYRCAGGLTLRELIYFIRLIKMNSKNLIIDIVEFNPIIEKDVSILVLKRLIEEIQS